MCGAEEVGRVTVGSEFDVVGYKVNCGATTPYVLHLCATSRGGTPDWEDSFYVIARTEWKNISLTVVGKDSILIRMPLEAREEAKKADTRAYVWFKALRIEYDYY
jgi:hypothetical protein